MSLAIVSFLAQLSDFQVSPHALKQCPLLICLTLFLPTFGSSNPSRSIPPAPLEMLVAVEPASVQILGGKRVPSSGDQLGVALNQHCSAKDKTVLSRALPPVL